MKKNSFLPLLEVILSGVLWGTVGIFTRYFNARGLAAADIVFIRLTLGTVLLFAFLLIKDRQAVRIRWKDLWIFAGAGIASVAVFQICYLTTIREASLSVAAVLLYTSPVFVTLFAALFFKEKITLRKGIAAVIAVLGCAMASGIFGSAVRLTLPVFLIGLGSGIGYALYSIFARAALNRGYSALTMTAWTFLFSLIPLAFLADYKAIGSAFGENGWEAAGMSLLLALLTASVPYFLYTHGLARMESGKAAVTVAVEPVVATLIGVTLFKESLTPVSALGTALVIAAIIVIGLPEKKK